MNRIGDFSRRNDGSNAKKHYSEKTIKKRKANFNKFNYERKRKGECSRGKVNCFGVFNWWTKGIASSDTKITT